MKKVLLAAIAASMVASCTQQMVTRYGGGTSEIELKKGQKLVEIAWKDEDLWLLTEPMDSDYIPKVKTFYEKSSFGVFEGVITIKESR